jgi:methylglutaconyl-CoA hydratase
MIQTELRDGVYAIRLNRPEVRNALNDALIAALTKAFAAPPAAARAVVLSGEGASFCAGADAEWMKRSKSFTREENARDAAAVSTMLQAIDDCPLPVIARIQGAAMGGGAGLAAVADIAVAEEGAQFGFSEVRLGLVPAVISTYVLPRIGIGAARRYFLTGERFDAAEARRIGLVHEVAPAGQLDVKVQAIVSEILKGGPQAVKAAKRLLRDVVRLPREKAVEETLRVISEIRVTPEAQEGLSAFLEKRKPNWP